MRGARHGSVSSMHSGTKPWRRYANSELNLRMLVGIIIKYLYSYTHKNIIYLNAVYIDLH